MPLSSEQLAAGRAVKRQLERCEAAHPNSAALHQLHRCLAELRDTFRDDMPDADYVTFGGGTNKDDDSGS